MTATGSIAQRTPLFEAQHSERYARHALIRQYEELVDANFVVMIDRIFPDNMTYLEEVICTFDQNRPLHVLLASLGGDGETAIRVVRSLQARCSELTIIVPDMAKSAATLICLGANRVIFGPGGDLGPVDPQLRGPKGVYSAKSIVSAVDEAERRVTATPDAYPLFAALLADVDMLTVEMAKSALQRSEALVKEALAANPERRKGEVTNLAKRLKKPLIDDPASHSAVFSMEAAKGYGLPVEAADVGTETWKIIWLLWTRYFEMGAIPQGACAIYENRSASQIVDLS